MKRFLILLINFDGEVRSCVAGAAATRYANQKRTAKLIPHRYGDRSAVSVWLLWG